MSDEDIQKLIKRIDTLEKRIEKNIQDQNRVNQKAYNHISGIEAKVEKTIQNQNKVNQKAYDHITSMERRFAKMDQRTQQVEKSGAGGDPRKQQKELMKFVDQAIKDYDRKRGKKGR